MMSLVRSISKKLETEINRVAKDENSKAFALLILKFEIEEFDPNNKTYTNEIESIMENILKESHK